MAGSPAGTAPGETDISIYVDATTEPSIHADVVSAVDLDLEVVQLRDGTVRVEKFVRSD
jgi:hypothetical protein